LQTTYNSRFFEHHPVDDLRLEPGKLRKVVKELADPDSVYDFSAMPVEIIGKAYEQFLGSVIRTTPKQVRIEPKPEVRKAGGVYYTPRYIVDYIVENTLGPLFEGRSLSQAVKIKILDPACGSGSFLIGAARWLERWYSKKYGRPTTYEERQTIVLRHLHGVDIDSNAVEVTQLSLCLWLLEEAPFQLKMLHQALLPDLSGNIRCGNSLIGSDFYSGDQYDLFDDAVVQHRVNAFDWDGPRGWPEIMRRGGFDAVIGNPPYVFARDKGFTDYEKDYYRKYKHHAFQLNTFTLFTEKGYYLLTNGGWFGFIIPNTWLSIGTMKSFRDFVVGSTGELTIVNNRFKVFPGANIDTSLVLFKKTTPSKVYLAESPRPQEVNLVAKINAELILQDPVIHFRLYKNQKVHDLLRKIKFHAIQLREIAIVKAGLKAYETGKGTPKQTDSMKKNRVYHSTEKLGKDYRIYLDGKDVKRYFIGWSGEYLKYGNNLAALRDSSLFKGERILVRQIPSRPPYSINAAIVAGEELNDINSMIVKTTSEYTFEYILGVINSKLLTFWFDYIFDKFQRAIFPQFKVNELATFPIRTIDFDNAEDVARHDRMVSLVERMLDLHERLPGAAGSDKAQIEQLIERTDHEIDRLVYELYDLTDDEIAIVEEAVSR
ncbi:N-6 DNA methylase, partial [bacterium]|nr:N-6 DNA methylase [bacterium]